MSRQGKLIAGGMFQFIKYFKSKHFYGFCLHYPWKLRMCFQILFWITFTNLELKRHYQKNN